MKLTWKIGNS